MVFLDLSIFRKAFRFIGAVLCDVIYTLISKVYELFMTIARLNILSSSQIQPIYQRITMILTIVMVFYVTFEFVKYTISPDTITDKEKGAGNILKKIIIVISLIALTPEIFTTAYKLQNRIIETQLISKIIIGNTNANYDTYGNDFSANMLNLFYYYDEDACSSSNAGLINDCSEAQQVAAEKINHIRETGDSDIVEGINLASGKATFKEVNPAIKFNGFLAIIVGGFILYILIMYSIDVGTRYAQLIFLQIISPIAIMGYILPKKDGIFQKWGKQCITTYLDLFIRIIIINFVLLVAKILGDSFQNGHIFEGLGNVSTGLKVFTYIALVMGLLAFAQRAPKLIGELFPSSGAAGIGFGLSPKDRGFAAAGRALGAAAGTAIGAGAGLATGIAQGRRRREAAIAKYGAQDKKHIRRAAIGGATWGAIRGMAGGAARGLYNGGKKGNMIKNVETGTKNEIEANKKFGNRQENGYTFKEQVGDTAKYILGMKSRIDAIEESKGPIKRQQDEYAALAKTNDALREHAFKKAKDKGYASYARYAEAEGRLKRLQEDKDVIATFVDTDAEGKIIANGTSSKAYQEALAAAGKDMKTYKDEATNDYLDSTRQKDASGNFIRDDKGNYVYDDGTLNNLVRERSQRLADYNEHASEDRKIKGVNENDMVTFKYADGSEFTGYIKDMTGDEFDQYIKRYANEENGKLSRELSSKTSEQEAIKRRISGSGVAGDGKK